VNLLARDVAKLPLYVYSRDGEGKQRAVNHAAYRLLRRKSNSELTAFQFRQLMMWRAVLLGNAYAFIVRRGDGAPQELIPLSSDPADTFPVRANGVLHYVTRVGGMERKLRREDVLHLRGIGDDLCGWSLVDKAKNSLGLGMAAQKHTSKFFSNGARPSTILEHPGKLSPEASKALREGWDRMHRGLDNSHKTAVLQEGMKAHVLTMSAKDMQWLETREFGIRDVANWLGVPPHKLGDTTRTSFSSLEQENQSYLDEALDPWLVAWEEECSDKLLTEPQKLRDTHFIEFHRAALLRADMPTRGEFYTKATGGHPFMTVNEVRGRENMNPMDGYDKIRVPTNNFTDPDAPQPEPATVADPEPAAEPEPQTNAAPFAESLRGVVEDVARRMCRRLKTHADRASKRGELMGWMEVGMEDEHRQIVADAFGPVCSALQSAGINTAAADVSGRLFTEAARAFIHNDTEQFTETYPARLADAVVSGNIEAA
jgi:HK97 family phage portal protein